MPGRRRTIVAAPRCPRARRIGISIDADVYDSVRNAATSDNVSVSAWLTNAARHALRLRDGLAAVHEWESEQAAFTSHELAAARRRVDLQHSQGSDEETVR